jgi:pimeloyl-ACP methyl ester carboxylesterase
MCACEIVVEADGIPISGLIAEAAPGPPRAAILAIPGNAMMAGYFDGPVDHGGSLLALGASEGFTVWAIDRPGYGASADAPDERVTLFGQADLVHRALDAFAAEHDVGAGFFVAAHSYGLKLALVMAADRRGDRLLGIDGVGTGLRYGINPRHPPAPVDGDRGPMWGPEHLYPDGTFERGRLPLGRVPKIQTAEAAAWPGVMRSIAADVALPVRFTYGERERLWPIDEESLAELRNLFAASPRIETAIQAGAGHNVSLSNAARAYHLRALAFAGECIR